MCEEKITGMRPLAFQWGYEGLSEYALGAGTSGEGQILTDSLLKMISSDRKQLGDVLVVQAQGPTIANTMLAFCGVSKPKGVPSCYVFNHGTSGY